MIVYWIEKDEMHNHINLVRVMTYIQRSWHFDDAQNWTSQEHVKYYPPNGMILFIQSEVQKDKLFIKPYSTKRIFTSNKEKGKLNKHIVSASFISKHGQIT